MNRSCTWARERRGVFERRRESLWRAATVAAVLAFGAIGCGSDKASLSDGDRGGAANTSGTSGEGNGGGSGVGGNTAKGGSGGGAEDFDCPPGVPLVAQGVGGGTSPDTVCDNGKGTAKFGERCLKSSDCEPGTFCFSAQCTAICGDTQRKVGEFSAMAPCQELFGFAVCVVSAKATSIPQSIFYCTPTCAKDADCSVGATCTQGQYYKSLPTMPATYEWYDLAKVCTVN